MDNFLKIMILKKKMFNLGSLTPILRDTDLRSSKLLKLRAYRVIFPAFLLIFLLCSRVTLAQIKELPFDKADDWIDSTPISQTEVQFFYKGEIVQNKLIDIDPNTKLSNVELIGARTLKVYSAPAFIEDIDGQIRTIESATTTQALFNEKYDALLNEQISFWKSAHAQVFSENTDASTYSSGSGSTWDSARQDTHGDSMDTSRCYVGGGKPSYYYIWRCLLQFNVSYLQDDWIVGTSSLFMWANAKWNQDNDGNDFITVVGNYATSTPYGTYHYNDIGSDNGLPDRASTTPVQYTTPIDIGSISTGQYTEFALNGFATSTLATSTSLKLGLREGHDINNDPYGAGLSDGDKLEFYNYTQTGTANDPYMIINFDLPDTETPTSTTCALSSIEFDNSLSSINYQSEIYSASGTHLTTEYGKYNIPLFAWVVLAIPFMWIMSRVILEILIRLRA